MKLIKLHMVVLALLLSLKIIKSQGKNESEMTEKDSNWHTLIGGTFKTAGDGNLGYFSIPFDFAPDNQKFSYGYLKKEKVHRSMLFFQLFRITGNSYFFSQIMRK